MPLLAINFHYVGMPDFPHAGINSLPVEKFRSLVGAIGREYDLIGLPELNRCIGKGSFSSSDQALITFDDGLRCQFEKAHAELENLGAPAAYFVQTGPRACRLAAATHKLHFLRATRGDETLFSALEEARADGRLMSSPSDLDPVEIARHYRYDSPEAAALKFFFNYHLDAETAEGVLDLLFARCGIDEDTFVDEFYLTVDQIRELGAQHAVASHGVSHRPFAKLSETIGTAELAESRRDLETWCGHPVEFISYPFGNEMAVNPGVGAMARAAGYLAGFTMERAKNRTSQDPLLLARIDVLDFAGHAELPYRSRYYQEVA